MFETRDIWDRTLTATGDFLDTLFFTGLHESRRTT